MSDFCIDNLMSKASKEPKEIFRKYNLSNWKLIRPESFFDHSLASIFENIFIRYPDNFESFCSSIIRHFPISNQIVSSIYNFLNNNLENIPRGFPEHSEYVIWIRSLSEFLVRMLNIDTSSLVFHNYRTFFNFFHIKIVTLNWNGTKFNYKSFGEGQFVMYFYVEKDIFYCLYHYHTDIDPFKKIVSDTVEKEVLFCGHRINKEEISKGSCSCGRCLFSEEVSNRKKSLFGKIFEAPKTLFKKIFP